MTQCDYQFYVNSRGQCSEEATFFYLGESHNYWRDRCQKHTLDHAAVVVRYPTKEARDLELLRRSL